MKPGVAGAILVFLAGGGGAGAIYVRDGQQLALAQSAHAEGLKLLGAGKLEDAEAQFIAAAAGATSVSPLTGRRAPALTVSADAHTKLRMISLIQGAKSRPLDLLRHLEDDAQAPPQSMTLRETIRLDLLLNTARALETKEELSQSATLFAHALEEARSNSSARVKECEEGHKRVLFLKSLQAAEGAARNLNLERAGELAESAHRVLSQQESLFEADRVIALRARIAKVKAESDSDRALKAHERAIAGFDAEVGGEKLGSLLGRVDAQEPPPLPSGHPRVKEHAARLAELERQRKAIRKVAKEFHGMVLARRGRVSVYLDRTEVSNAEFAKFVQAGGYTTKSLWSSEGLRQLETGRFRDKTGKTAPGLWKNATPPATRGAHPVCKISRFEAEAYASWNKKRLPSWEEWKAAAAAPGNAYPWGRSWQKGRANDYKRRLKDTLPVNSLAKGAAPSGALHMSGNVREMVRVGEEAYKAVGGSFKALPSSCKVSSGLGLEPWDRPEDTGFRCAKDLKWPRR